MNPNHNIRGERGGEEDHESIHLQVAELIKHQSNANLIGGSTIFEPRTSIEKGDSNATTSIPNTVRPNSTLKAPEKKLTLFALRLAILEKAATGLGTLGFIWATVVLLGGFAITLDPTDFWFITIILLIEGTRIFGRSHELEWQHQSAWSLTDAGRSSFRILRSGSSSLALTFCRFIFRPIQPANQKQREIAHSAGIGTDDKHYRGSFKNLPSRRWSSSEVPILPYIKWIFLSRNISKLLHWVQIIAAAICVALSSTKLIERNYGSVQKGDTDKRNRKAALTIFYYLALAEAVLFLLEKAYWELKVIYFKVLEDVSAECELGPSGLVPVRRFFYDAYSKCVNGSIFDGLKMDMVSFAVELLDMETLEEQVIGARILRKFVISERFCGDALQKIGVTFSVVERLVEMLNWKDPREEEMRYSAAIILSKLAGKKQNSLRVAEIPGAMESISSLLYTNREPNFAADEVGDKNIVFDQEHYGYWTFSHLGMLILKKLARDIDNCGKIGNTRGLLPKIVDFTYAEERVLMDENVAPSQILTVKRSLQVVKMLASTTGSAGKQLRRDISEIVFTFSNLRDVLRYGEKHPTLQRLGIEILTSLAIDDDARERIGETGGILKELLNIFFKERVVECQNCVRIAAGEALAMLTLNSGRNCRRVVRSVDALVGSLDNKLLRRNGARILTNLCTYGGDDCVDGLRGGGVVAAVPTVLKGIMMSEEEENKLQEVMVVLAARAFKFMAREESTIMFEKAGITETEVAEKIVQILRKYPDPSTRVPRIRRFTIELAIWMLRNTEVATRVFIDLELANELENVLNTTSEIENFHIFSGTVGLNRYRTTIHSLVETAIDLLTVASS